MINFAACNAAQNARCQNMDKEIIVKDKKFRQSISSDEIQKNVKQNGESMTGLNANEVNVHVQGVVTMQKREESEAKIEAANSEKKAKAKK